LKSEPRCLLREIVPPSLANLERPGNEGRYGPTGESIGWVETPNLSLGDIQNSWEARARLFHELKISWQPLRRWLGVVPAIPKVGSDNHAYEGSGNNGDDLPRFEVNLEC
jgi:hypothetical protein